MKRERSVIMACIKWTRCTNWSNNTGREYVRRRRTVQLARDMVYGRDCTESTIAHTVHVYTC